MTSLVTRLNLTCLFTATMTAELLVLNLLKEGLLSEEKFIEVSSVQRFSLCQLL